MRFKIFIILLCSPLLCFALSTDKNQPIHIDADAVNIDNLTGISNYEGNVSLQQGSLIITANSVQIIHKKTQEKIILTGQPVQFKQTTDDNKQIRGKAEKIEYFSKLDKVMLYTNVHLKLGEQSFRGQQMEYDIVKSIIKTNGKDRIHITIFPEKK